MAGFFSELKHRRVYQSAAIYAVAAWGLAQVIDFLAERLFMPEWVPTLTAIIFIVGFPVAIFLAWVFDIGADGIRRNGLGSIRGIFSIVAAVVMLTGGTALIYAIVWPRHEAAIDAQIPDPNSIAVLPFSHRGSVDENEYLADGIAEEILFALGSLTDLRVAARTSSFSFRGDNKTAADISRELNVRHIVEGTVRVLGDRLRVTASLVRGDTNLELWSQSYEEPIDDLFKVQEDIAARVVEAVRIEMGAAAVGERPRFRAVAENSEAYRLYMQGRFLWHQRGRENIRSAIAFFEQAIALEPEFAGAWAGLASAYLTSPTYGVMIEGHLTKANDAARKAIEIDSSLGEPYGTLAQVEIDAGNFAEAERLINIGIGLSPQNTSLRLWYATMLLQYGRSLDANKQAAIALQRDPAYPILHGNFGFSSFQLGRYDDARDSMGKAWQLGVRSWFMWLGILDAIAAQGDFPAALAWFDEMPRPGDPERIRTWVDLHRAWVGLLETQTPETRAEFDRLAEAYMANPAYGKGRLAYMLSSIGDGDAALELNMQETMRGDRPNLGQLWVPPYSAMRQQPDFSKLAGMLRLTEYWRAVEWPDVCGPGESGEVECYR